MVIDGHAHVYAEKNAARIAEECPNAIFDTSITMTGEKCIYRIHDPFWEPDPGRKYLQAIFPLMH